MTEPDEDLKPHGVLHFFKRLHGHLSRLVDANGGTEESFNLALSKLDAVLKSDTPAKGLMAAGQEILTYLERGYAAQEKKLTEEVERLDKNAP